MFMQQLGFSASVMVLGLLIVFVGLIILIGAVKALSAVLGNFTDKAKQPKAPEEPAPVAAPTMAAPAELVELTDDPQLIAVIAAAIAACQGTSKRLVVRSVRRLPGGWNTAAREETLNY